MKSSELQLLAIILLAILVFILVHLFNRGKKKYDPQSSFQGPGQLFDTDTYTGNIRFLIFSCLWIYGGRHIDEIGQWLWHLFGSELVIPPGKAEWYARVATAMGMVGLMISIMNIQRIYKARGQKNELRHKTDEEVSLRLKERDEQAGKIEKQR